MAATQPAAFDQELPPFYSGEDVTGSAAYGLRLTHTADPSGWSVRFTLAPAGGGAAVTVTSAAGEITVSSSAKVGTRYTVTFAVTIPKAKSAVAAGTAGWQFDRADTGFEWVLGQGTLEVLAPLAAVA